MCFMVRNLFCSVKILGREPFLPKCHKLLSSMTNGSYLANLISKVSSCFLVLSVSETTLLKKKKRCSVPTCDFLRRSLYFCAGSNPDIWIVSVKLNLWDRNTEWSPEFGQLQPKSLSLAVFTRMDETQTMPI